MNKLISTATLRTVRAKHAAIPSVLMATLVAVVSCSALTTEPLEESAAQGEAVILEPEAPATVDDASAEGGEAAALYRRDERARFVLEGVQDGTYAVSVRVRGDHYEGWPIMRLLADGEQLGQDAEVTLSSYDEKAFGEVALRAGQTLEAIFMNDNWGGSPDKDRNLYVDHLTLKPVTGEAEPDTHSTCTDERLELGTRESHVWTSDTFEGTFCREVVGDGKSLTLTLDAEEGGFDTAIVSDYNPTQVDDLRAAPLPVSATIIPDFSGSGSWWIGPKFSVREAAGQSLEGNFENYIVENASRTPEEYHERLTSRDGSTYLGETRQNGGVYRHYLVPHPYRPISQFWAVRQGYRESGTVDLALVLEKWRAEGLPDQLVPSWRVNVETHGEVEGALMIDELSFPASLAD